MEMTRYIFITGGVISGLGKGIVTSSIGRILQSKGFKVTAIKIDPYLNYDAGTLRPTEHGEVWVTEDGGEIDQDLGHYERFMDITLTKDHNITSGKIYYSVIEKERRGEYLGQTVQPIPHVTDEIKSWIMRVAESSNVDFILVEIGGVVGDYENILFLEAARQIKIENPERVLFVHVAYLPVPRTIGEMKTKPVQHSVKLLREIGIQPDFIIARSEYELDDVRRRKIALFCNVDEYDIISDPDLELVYELPIIFDKEGLGDKILAKCGLAPRESHLKRWRGFVEALKVSNESVKIGIVGKYFSIGKYSLPDAYVSVIEAIRHASAYFRVKPSISYINAEELERGDARFSILSDLDAIIVPGGFGSKGVLGKLGAIEYARVNGVPYLGLCYGFQLAVVEYARNVCGLSGANTTEIDPETPYPVVDLLPEQKEVIRERKLGGSMRLGGHKVIIKKNTLAFDLYGRDVVVERFRHRYEINPDYVPVFLDNGFIFSGESVDGIKQMGELPRDVHPYFIGSQFHPEFTSRPLKPNPLFRGLIDAAIRRKRRAR
jgi:CTP synthase